jgi:hypoxanthine phosphoribosyltransferase
MSRNRRLRESTDPHHVREVLFSAAQIQARVNSLVEELSAECKVDDLVMVGILRGSFMFLADLVRDFYLHEVHPRIDFMTLSSYGAGTASSGRVEIQKDLRVNVEGADVLLVDDILDTGRTLRYACEHLRSRAVRSVKTCVLLDKPSRRATPMQADYCGFTIEDHFVVGYGLDYASFYRDLPYIARLTFLDRWEP